MAAGGKGPKSAKFDPANHISDPAHPIWTKCGMDIPLDPRNKAAEQFFIYRKIQDGCRLVKGPKLAKFDPPKSQYGPAFESGLSNLD